MNQSLLTSNSIISTLISQDLEVTLMDKSGLASNILNNFCIALLQRTLKNYAL